MCEERRGGGGGGGICSDQFLKQIRENDILSVYSSHFTAKFSPKRVEIIDMVNDEKKKKWQNLIIY